MISRPTIRRSVKPGRAVPKWKRGLDLVLSLPGILALLPVFALIALAIRLTSPGPVFFVQSRVGVNGQHFGMVKFRSMFVDAEARRVALEGAGDRDGLCFKLRDDPRVTSVGRILRRSSLDELPQLFNVILGDMSLVGPRPALPQEVACYPDAALGRLKGLPGITGLWQVSGRADIGFDEMIGLDLAYLRRQSLSADLAILARTVRVVLTGRGAY